MTPFFQTILTAFLAALGSSGLMSIILYKIQRRDHKKDKAEANDSVQAKMLLGLGHDKLLYLTNRIVRRGRITLKERTNLEYLYKPYSQLGGNGDCETGYKECIKLPTIDDEKAERLDTEFKRSEYGIE